MYPSSRVLWLAAVNLALSPQAFGQFPPTPEDVTILNSKFNDGVYISYKEVCYSSGIILDCLMLTIDLSSLVSARLLRASSPIVVMFIYQQER